MTEKKIPTEKQPIMVTEGAEAPFLLYSGDDEKVHVRVLIHAESLWLTQRLMADLFQTSADNINLHLKNIFAEGELEESATTEDFSVVQNEGGRAVRRMLKHYSLDAIIAVGYRVSSKRATQFRIWATQILKEYIRKGFVLDDERLKQGKRVFGEDYFQELLERVRSIRASERRIYQQITDILLITIQNRTSRKTSMAWCKTSFTTPLPVRPQPRSFCRRLIALLLTWAYLLGKMHLMAVSSPQM